MLSSRQSGPIQAPEDPETREIVERTAALVGTHGLLMERRLLAVNVNDERYDFLRSRQDHPYYDFYRRKVVEHEMTPDDEPSGDLLLFTCPPQGITRKEFGALKLTAQFVARYGMSFWRDLIHCVTMNPNPLFEFVKTSDINFSLLLRLVDAYEMALEPYKKSCLHRTNPKETVLEGFFYLVEGEKHSEEVGVQLATIDLHAFVSGLDFIASREVGQLLPPGVLSTQMRSGALPPSDEDDDDDDDDDATLEVHHPSPEEHQYYPFTYPQGRLRLSPAAREIILDGFFYLLEDGSDIATSDLHAFVGGIDYFAKRENYEKSALLPQHPQSYTFR
ncbi:probable splicing factor 3A subunit 1 isoform X3 [Brassica napus]|uniref:probable splicing factor 3A subunit 1 isoform X3 n=1 Tax=Brassica napus TaxID=3708 RepID=UPI0006AB5EC1|nr:probable splicing factor 3A subunit 1 isoform X3 [Brassica napus]